MWDLPGPGLVSPALAGGFLTTALPGKSGMTLRAWPEHLEGCSSHVLRRWRYKTISCATFASASAAAFTKGWREEHAFGAWHGASRVVSKHCGGNGKVWKRTEKESKYLPNGEQILGFRGLRTLQFGTMSQGNVEVSMSIQDSCFGVWCL